MSPFEIKSLNKKMRTGKSLSFDEALSGLQVEDAQVLDDERDSVNYRLLGLAVLVAFVALFGRIYFLQAVKGDDYRAMAEGNKLRTRYVMAPRGLVLDKYGKTIAGNIPSFELTAIPKDLYADASTLEQKIRKVSQILGKPESEIKDALNKMDKDSFQAHSVLENLPKDTALTLIGMQDQLKGFLVENNPIRDYKDPLIFSHLVGYTGKINAQELEQNKTKRYLLNDYIGKTGLEIQYEDYLRGVPGQKQNEIDATGDYHKTLAELPAVPGNNIKLNIDYELQKKIYESTVEVMKRGRARKAAVVATNPKTGEVLALLSLPGFDNNMFARGITGPEYSSLINDPGDPLLNRAVAGLYPPGSTVKPMLGLAALTEKVVEPTTKIIDDGVIRVGDFTYYGYNRSGLGMMDVYSAIARSSDIYFYTVGGGRAGSRIEGLGPERLAKWYRNFYLGQKLGIDLPQEKPGLVPDPEWKQKTLGEAWYLGNTYHYSIGQDNLLVTPLQVNSWTATLANGGRIMQPYILSEVVDKNNRVIHSGKPRVLKENFLDQNYLKVVQDAMRQTITAGSAQSLKSLPVEISGKTGTAQFINRNLTATHAWFTSYAPSSDPQIALTVLVEEGGEGSSVSVPISKTVYEWWVENRYNK